MQERSQLGGEKCCSGCTLQAPACVANARGSHTIWLQRQGSCNPAKPQNGKAAKLELADDGSHLSNIKVALLLTKALCSAPVQNQNDGSPFQNIYGLIKRQETIWVKTGYIFLWMSEEKCSVPCQACWKLCSQNSAFCIAFAVNDVTEQHYFMSPSPVRPWFTLSSLLSG